MPRRRMFEKYGVLPSRLQRVEYIKNNGLTIDCGVYTYAGFELRAKPNETAINKSFIGTPIQHVFTWSGVVAIRDSQSVERISVSNDLQFHVFGWDVDSSQVFIDNRRVDVSKFAQTAKHLYLFCDGNPSYPVRIINASIDYVNLTVERKTVASILACRDKDTNEAVFYDVINRKEFRAIGMTCGPDVL